MVHLSYALETTVLPHLQLIYELKKLEESKKLEALEKLFIEELIEEIQLQ